MKVFHVVGWQGTGKSTLVRMMADLHTSRGAVCADVVADVSRDAGREAIVREHAHVDYLFIEHYPDAPLELAPGDTVIWINVVPGAPVDYVEGH
jgi:ABC-type nitrate/sulfonate/bicarbonate transport system ATPase subunit